MQGDGKGGLRFVPVPGTGGAYEMCAAGLVRRCGAAEPDELAWQWPVLPASGREAVSYRLRLAGGGVLTLAVPEVFAAFGGSMPDPQVWVRGARQLVCRLNRAHARSAVWRERMPEHEDGDDANYALPEHVMTACPWASGAIGGDAAGADPVCGF